MKTIKKFTLSTKILFSNFSVDVRDIPRDYFHL